MGLATCRERLELSYQKRASLEITPRSAGGTRVVLRFPVG